MKECQEWPVTASEYHATPAVAETVDYSVHQVGHVASIDENGRAMVVFAGNLLVPVAARTTVRATATELVGAPVLLVFEGGDPERPIIVGVLKDSLTTPVLETAPVSEDALNTTSAAKDLTLQLDTSKEGELRIDGESIVFNAEREITLRCGKSTLQLRRDGKILIRGSHVLSRSSGPNRIKGASINLN